MYQYIYTRYVYTQEILPILLQKTVPQITQSAEKYAVSTVDIAQLNNN